VSLKTFCAQLRDVLRLLELVPADGRVSAE